MLRTDSILAVPILALAVAPYARARPPDCGHLPRPVATRAVPNDNRAAIGVLANGMLTVRLVARPAAWYPDGRDGCGLTVHAFAEEGKAPRIPGPLLRVPAGTELRVTIRNALDKPIWIRGLEDRSVERLDSVAIAVNASREFRYRATVPGTYFYWGGDVDAAVPRSNVDGQLVGALIVDSSRGPAPDRIFTLTRWARPAEPGLPLYELNAINGRSWPNTERLEVVQGTPVRWRIINASNFVHYMHLHGFYFTILSTGNAAREHARGARPVVEVTEAVNDGGTFMLQWTPERTGNWLFHCHLAIHMSADQRLDRMPGARLAGDRKGHDPTTPMGGLVLGVTVHAAPGAVTRVPGTARRQLRLFADVREHVYGPEPGYGFVLEEDGRAPARDSIRIPGTPIVLTRGEPVRITVFNRLPYPLTVHWHGIELERSYFDGVADFSGEPGHPRQRSRPTTRSSSSSRPRGQARSSTTCTTGRRNTSSPVSTARSSSRTRGPRRMRRASTHSCCRRPGPPGSVSNSGPTSPASSRSWNGSVPRCSSMALRHRNRSSLWLARRTGCASSPFRRMPACGSRSMGRTGRSSGDSSRKTGLTCRRSPCGGHASFPESARPPTSSSHRRRPASCGWSWRTW